MSQTLQEQAKELVEKFILPCTHYYWIGNSTKGEVDIVNTFKAAKQCALICNQREIDVVERLLATRLNNDFDLMNERHDLRLLRTEIEKL